MRREPAVVLTALGLWVAACLLIASAPVVVFVTGGCESRCPSTAVRLAIGAVPIVAAAVPLYFACALVLRWRGRPPRRQAAGVTLALTAYVLAAGALAWWFADKPVVHGDAAWTAFWVIGFVGWVGLGAALLRR